MGGCLLLLLVLAAAGLFSCCPSGGRAVQAFRTSFSVSSCSSSWCSSSTSPLRRALGGRRSSSSLSSSSSSEEEEEEEGVQDARLCTVSLSGGLGIDWGTDLSFKWVYVRELDPMGSAARNGLIKVGDQLVSLNGDSCVAAPFDYVINLLGAASRSGEDIEFTFFRGSRDELAALAGAGGAASLPQEVRVVVQQKGRPDVELTCSPGTNLRDLCVENGINVYQSITRWTNCKGRQLCGTCIVNVREGGENCTVRSIDESSTLRSNPPSYRLSCVTNLYGDVTVEALPPIGKDQWTR